MKHKTNLFIISFFCIAVFFIFRGVFIHGLLPIPSDTIIGLYHPFRDLYAKEYPNGIPFKNFLITDPVRQQYPWRNLAITIEKKAELPLWNPYNLSGTPLLANFQTSALYPGNMLFFILPFNFAWVILVMLQTLLAGLFLYIYLRFWELDYFASFLGAFVFAFCGFSIAWMEWNTILHVGLWLPLLLLAIDKIVSSIKYRVLSIKDRKVFLWSGVYTLALISSFFAGHLQTFFYLFLITIGYFFVRWFQLGRQKNILFLFILLNTVFIILTSIQWIPTLQFISESARDIDQADWQKAGWFLPWEHLIQFLAPDFFGNPTTLNYWGVWNYAEFLGYIGIFPLGLAFSALFFRRDKKTLFFGCLFFFSFIFALPTAIAKIPFLLQIPFLATAQPTRLLYSIDFTIVILAALGLDYFIKTKRSILPFIILISLYIPLWFFVLFTHQQDLVFLENITVAKRNLLLPTFLAVVVGGLVFLLTFVNKGKKQSIILVLLLCITFFDLSRLADKFLPFTEQQYLFPQTKVISFIQKNGGNFRIMTTDDRILPPNFSIMYKLQSIDGYDPLYLRRYGELIVASERGKPDISPPFGFNRIITPHNYNSKIIDLLGVKYILSLSDITSPKLNKVFQEGETRVYENKDAFPRVFFVEGVQQVITKERAIQRLFDNEIDLKKTAIIEVKDRLPLVFPDRNAQFPLQWHVENLTYTENVVTVKTDTNRDAFLVLTDSYYPTWHVKIDGVETLIYRTNFNFRGIFVPEGKHTIEFYNTLF